MVKNLATSTGYIAGFQPSAVLYPPQIMGQKNPENIWQGFEALTWDWGGLQWAKAGASAGCEKWWYSTNICVWVPLINGKLHGCCCPPLSAFLDWLRFFFCRLRHDCEKGVEDEAHAYAVYRLQDEADDWEKSYRAHPSILDSALQSGSVIGAAKSNPS